MAAKGQTGSWSRAEEGVLAAVPANTPLRRYERDIGMCCVAACSYPTAALEFTPTGSGTIRQ